MPPRRTRAASAAAAATTEEAAPKRAKIQAADAVVNEEVDEDEDEDDSVAVTKKKPAAKKKAAKKPAAAKKPVDAVVEEDEKLDENKDDESDFVAAAKKLAAKTKAAKKPAAAKLESIERSATPRAAPAEGNVLRVLSINVAGLRAVLVTKGADKLAALQAVVAAEAPDVLCLNEHKLQAEHVEAVNAQLDDALPGYARRHWTCSGPPGKKGYSGVAMLFKDSFAARYGAALEVVEGMPGVDAAADDAIVQHEGRLLTLAMPGLALVATYVPNSGQKLERLAYRVGGSDGEHCWDRAFERYVGALGASSGAVVVVGDLNVAHGAEDIHNLYARPDFGAMRAGDVLLEDQYAGNSGVKKAAGLTPQERASFGQLLRGAGLVDAFKRQHADATGVFSYFSQRFPQNKVNNKGLRIDYVLASHSLYAQDASQEAAATQRPRLHDAFILDQVPTIADHAPVGCHILLA